MKKWKIKSQEGVSGSPMHVYLSSALAWSFSPRMLRNTSHRYILHIPHLNFLPPTFPYVDHSSEIKNPRQSLQNLKKTLTLARVVKPTSVNWEHLATSNILLKKKRSESQSLGPWKLGLLKEQEFKKTTSYSLRSM